MSEDKKNLKDMSSEELVPISNKWIAKLDSAIDMIEESCEWMDSIEKQSEKDGEFPSWIERRSRLQEVRETLREMNDYAEKFHPAYKIIDERKTALFHHDGFPNDMSEEDNEELSFLFEEWEESAKPTERHPQN